MQCTISTQTSRGAKTTTHAGDRRLGHFRRKFVGQRLLMATCGLGGPMNPKSKTCFRYFPTNPTKHIIYIYITKTNGSQTRKSFQVLCFYPNQCGTLSQSGSLQKSLQKPCKLFSLLAHLQNPIEKNSVFHMVLIVFVAIPNGTASYRRLTLVFVLCY